ncbi:hypothetical protein ILYODFUR_038578 [Ilyodon furcidens]|uniref:Secreted protein n=1 Tax=Ilyodon furcidens TaxID=33524 RepID=A0ABV0SVB0_9TELE
MFGLFIIIIIITITTTKMAPTMAASELRSLFVFVFCVFLCFSSHSSVVSGHNPVVSFSREELLNIRESSLRIFSPSFIDLRFNELLASGAAALCGILRRKRRRGKRAGKAPQKRTSHTTAFNPPGKCPLSKQQDGRAASSHQ